MIGCIKRGKTLKKPSWPSEWQPQRWLQALICPPSWRGTKRRLQSFSRSTKFGGRAEGPDRTHPSATEVPAPVYAGAGFPRVAGSGCCRRLDAGRGHRCADRPRGQCRPRRCCRSRHGASVARGMRQFVRIFCVCGHEGVVAVPALPDSQLTWWACQPVRRRTNMGSSCRWVRLKRTSATKSSKWP